MSESVAVQLDATLPAQTSRPTRMLSGAIPEYAWSVLIVASDMAYANAFRGGVNGRSDFRTVGIVARGEDALEFMRRVRVDLVVLDLRSIGMDGIETMDRIRMARHQAEVIVVSGARDSRVVRATLHRGAVDYLVLPFAPVRFQEALDLFVNRVNALQDGQLDQEAIDRARAAGRSLGRDLPKGLSTQGVEKVHEVLSESDSPVSSAQVALSTGMTRVSARRYLEHLVTIDQAAVEVELRIEGRGRPRKMYSALRW